MHDGTAGRPSRLCIPPHRASRVPRYPTTSAVTIPNIPCADSA
jgi:hypothetical protein